VASDAASGMRQLTRSLPARKDPSVDFCGCAIPIESADYYQTINCYQYRAPGCPPFNTDIVDPAHDCII
jgi:hypothetical protein